MMAVRKYLLVLLTAQFVALCLPAQMLDDTNGARNFKPEFRRLINHEAIDKEQSSLLASDGKIDNHFVVSANEEINTLLTNTLVGMIDNLQVKTETDS
jgi:hypothetical protein